MKTNFFSIISLISILALFQMEYSQGQSVSINNTANPPDGSSMLDVSATNKGLLIPRVALTGTGSAGPVTSPATSLLVYNTASVSDVTPGYYYWTGSAWTRFATGSLSYWSLTGNTLTGTLPGTPNEWIGSANGADVLFKANGTERLRILSSGALKINNVYTLPTADGSNGQILTTNGTGSLSWSAVSSLNSVPGNISNNVSSGSWVCPAGVTKVMVEAWGGGGGTGGSQCGTGGGSAGGGGGGYSKALVSVTPGTTYYITVGGGGAGGGSTGAGGNGGASCFSTAAACGGTILVRANGGSGSACGTGAVMSGGAGGTGGTGDLLIDGKAGQNSCGGCNGGDGGDSPQGGLGGYGGYASDSNSNTVGISPGGGGGGSGNCGGCSGKAGGAGKVVMYY